MQVCWGRGGSGEDWRYFELARALLRVPGEAFQVGPPRSGWGLKAIFPVFGFQIQDLSATTRSSQSLLC